MTRPVVFINPPEVCDMCAKPFGKIMHDAPTALGPWGCLCEHCFAYYGRGGQKYRRNDDGKFVKEDQ